MKRVRAIYRCSNRRCKRQGIEVPGLPPAEHRATTGRFYSCERCHQPLTWLREEEIPEQPEEEPCRS